VLLHPVDGINAGGAWREPGPWGIEKSISDGVNCSSAKPQIRRVQLWPTIIWRPIQGKAPGWELEETPDLDGLMVPMGGYREIATRWTTLRVFSDSPSIASVCPVARPGRRRVGTAVSVFGKATGRRIYLHGVNDRGVDRSKLAVRVKALRYYDLKLWFLADKNGQVSKRRTDDVQRALDTANKIFKVQANVSFRNVNERLNKSVPVPQLIGPRLEAIPVGNALNFRARSRDILNAFQISDKTHGTPILANIVWINRLAGIEEAHEGGYTYSGHEPILIFVTDLALREIQGEVLAHELGHALLDKYSNQLGYDNGHSTNKQDLMFDTADRHGRIRLSLDEIEFINP